MQQHTVIFVPHARAKLRKWRFTTLQAGLLGGALAALTLGGLVAAVLYFDTAFDRRQLDEIRRENAELREVNQSFERSIRDLSGQLEEYQRQIHKLAIAAGVAELTPTASAGIGGPTAIEANLLGEADMAGDLVRLESWADELGRGMTLLEDRVEELRTLISRTPAVAPVKGLVSSGFGYRRDPFTRRRAFHGGIDIVAPRGKEVRATGDGLVIKTGRLVALGNAVYVAHGYGVTTRYGHLLKITVEEGQKVRRGDVIGLVGSTGRSTGNHLHYEVRIDGQPSNPLGHILNIASP